MTHFSDGDFARWQASGPGDAAETARIVAHVGECAACAARFASMVRDRTDGEAAWSDDVSDFARAGAELPFAPPAPAGGRSRWAWVALPVAAAALMASALPLLMRTPAPAAPARQLRGETLHALSPSGTVGPDARFSWSSGISAARYRIEVSGPAGTVYSMDASQSDVAFPSALLGQLQPGVPYTWSVTAVDSDGRPLASSERRTFTLRTR